MKEVKRWKKAYTDAMKNMKSEAAFYRKEAVERAV